MMHDSQEGWSWETRPQMFVGKGEKKFLYYLPCVLTNRRVSFQRNNFACGPFKKQNAKVATNFPSHPRRWCDTLAAALSITLAC